MEDVSQKISYVEPGQVVATKQEFLRGHGTHLKGELLVASAAGFVEKTSRLLSVLPARSRYQPKVGHVIVGRVKEVADKRWKVDCNSSQYANLDISSIHLPGNIQRRRTREDQLHMRNFFVEGDLLAAEVQTVKSDGSFNLHMRTLKYGKLVTGVLVVVQQSLIRHLKNHMISLPNGVDLVLGHNGFIWITHLKTENQRKRHESLSEIHQLRTIPIPNKVRYEIVRIRNCIEVLNRCFLAITTKTIMLTYQRAKELNLQTSHILHRENEKTLSSYVEANFYSSPEN